MKALLFERQWIHLFSLAVLGAVVAYSSTLPGYRDGELFDISTHAWLWVAVSCSVLHQVYVWFTCCAELRLKLLSRLLGSRAFTAYSAGFLLLLVLRFASIVLVAAANRGSWRIHPLVGWGSSVLLVLLPVGYSLYSIQKYFSFKCVLGIDHFDPACRSLGLVRRDIFKYTPTPCTLSWRRGSSSQGCPPPQTPCCSPESSIMHPCGCIILQWSCPT